jgi:hypothetical protein
MSGLQRLEIAYRCYDTYCQVVGAVGSNASNGVNGRCWEVMAKAVEKWEVKQIKVAA